MHVPTKQSNKDTFDFLLVKTWEIALKTESDSGCWAKMESIHFMAAWANLC